MIVMLCPYFIMGWWKLPGLSWLLCPLVLSHVGRSFLPSALAIGRSIPAPWLFGVVLLCWESLMIFWHCFGCPNVLWCLCSSCFISISWFTDDDWDTARDFGDIPPIPEKFSVQSSLGFWLFAGKSQLLELGLLKDWCSQGFPVMGVASELSWWELEIWGIGRKERNKVLNLLLCAGCYSHPVSGTQLKWFSVQQKSWF